MTKPLLEVKNLNKHFSLNSHFLARKSQRLIAVNDVSFTLNQGETLGLVGESGCGKSTLGRTILNLYKANSGQIIFKGRDLATLSKSQWREVRKEIQMVFQDPLESLNQRHTIANILEEPFIIHKAATAKQRKYKVTELLERVGLPSDTAHRYPHEFSGGQRQRIGIARAIALEPSLLICDEAVSALDVSIQAQILNLLLELQQDMGIAMLFIAHDLGVVKHMSDHIAVMYLGKIVEQASAHSIHQNAKHPYTQALISAIPAIDKSKQQQRIILKGDVPSPLSPPSGCVFRTRCQYAQEKCRVDLPALSNETHKVACHYPIDN